jgi:hypothetical protein
MKTIPAAPPNRKPDINRRSRKALFAQHQQGRAA